MSTTDVGSPRMIRRDIAKHIPRTISSLSKKLKNFLKDAEEALVVLDFYATWCVPCKMLAPKIKELAELYPEVKFAKVDVDENEDIALDYGIQAMPTIVFIKNCHPIDEVFGYNDDKVVELLQKHMF